MRYIHALILALLVLGVPAQSQTVAVSTNNVLVRFADFGTVPVNTARITLQALASPTGWSSYYFNPSQTISATTAPAQVTNGFCVFSNQICGLPYRIILAGAYSTFTTNFLVPATTLPDTNGTIAAAKFVGRFYPPFLFVYANGTTNSTPTNSADYALRSDLTNAIQTAWIQSSNWVMGLGFQTAGQVQSALSSCTLFDPAGAARAATNGLASGAFAPAYVLPPSVVTNGSSQYGSVNLSNLTSQVTVSSNGNMTTYGNLSGANVTASGSVTANAFYGNGYNLTGISYANLTGTPTIPNTNGFITASVTNGLASLAYVNAATLSASNWVMGLGYQTAGQVQSAISGFGGGFLAQWSSVGTNSVVFNNQSGVTLNNLAVGGVLNSNQATVIGSAHNSAGTTIWAGDYGDIILTAGFDGGHMVINGGQTGHVLINRDAPNGVDTHVVNGNLFVDSGYYSGNASGLTNATAYQLVSAGGSVTTTSNTVLISSISTVLSTNVLIVTNSAYSYINGTYTWNGSQYVNANGFRCITNTGSAWFLQNYSTHYNFYWITNATFPTGTWNVAGTITNPPVIVSLGTAQATNSVAVTGGKYYGDGSGLTNIPASAIAASPITVQSLATVWTTNGFISNYGTNTVTVSGFSIGDGAYSVASGVYTWDAVNQRYYLPSGDLGGDPWRIYKTGYMWWIAFDDSGNCNLSCNNDWMFETADHAPVTSAYTINETYSEYGGYTIGSVVFGTDQWATNISSSSLVWDLSLPLNSVTVPTFATDPNTFSQLNVVLTNTAPGAASSLRLLNANANNFTVALQNAGVWLNGGGATNGIGTNTYVVAKCWSTNVADTVIAIKSQQ